MRFIFLFTLLLLLHYATADASYIESPPPAVYVAAIIAERHYFRAAVPRCRRYLLIAMPPCRRRADVFAAPRAAAATCHAAVSPYICAMMVRRYALPLRVAPRCCATPRVSRAARYATITYTLLFSLHIVFFIFHFIRHCHYLFSLRHYLSIFISD